MQIPEPRVGQVICFSYVWRHEYHRGERDGRKNRPCVVVLASARDPTGRVFVTVAPISHAPPRDPAGALEIWPATKQRLGLDGARSWVVIDDLNIFAWPGYDLQPVPGRPETCLYGSMPAAFMRQIQSRIMIRAAEITRSNRDA